MEPKGSLPHLQVPAMCPILSHLDPVHTTTSNFLKIHLNVILPFRPGSSKWALSLRIPPPKTCIHLISPVHATFRAHLILLDVITWIILGEEYRSLSSSLCSFLHSPVLSSLLGPNILLSTLFSNTLSLRFSLSANYQVSHPYKTNRQNFSSLYLNLYIFG